MFITAALLVVQVTAFAPADYEPVLARVFGDAIRLDAARVAEVTQGAPGKRHYYDTDGDGTPDEVWYVDTAKRHPDDTRPLLVRVIDEDGDLVEGEEPDLDSDLYVADWKADGVVNVILDYADLDGDGDLDEVALYSPSYRKTERPEVMAWWGLDVGDDNLLWYDVGFGYRQGDCQTRSHFGGNEIFCAFTISMDDPVWVPRWENPFAFYDYDGDNATEEVVRIEGEMYEVFNLRHSLDTDNDSTAENPRDFDVSISAHAPDAPTETILMTPGFLANRGRGGVRFDKCVGRCYTLRGISTGPVLGFHDVLGYALNETWADMLMTWDENDLNIDGAGLKDGRFTDTQERWEGIIAPGTDGFKQIGGPHCGPFNKRYELRTSPGPIRIYYSPVDKRIHLFGAGRSWLIVDYDYDNQPDARYDYADANGDGYIDIWNFDADADGTPDDTWSAGDAVNIDLPYTWAGVHAILEPALEGLESLYTNVRGLDAALKKLGEAEDPLYTFIKSGYDSPYLTPDLRQRLLVSRQAWFYTLDVLRARMAARLKVAHADAGTIEVEVREGVPTLAALQGGLLARITGPHVAWAQDWVPPNIGWENEAAAYRAYWGQFDFFGKTTFGLVLPGIAGVGNYHAEQDWGVDALHVGDTCGLGGTTLYVNGTPYPAYSPGGKGPIQWTKRLVSESPGEIKVELLAQNVGPADAPYTVRFTCAIGTRLDEAREPAVDADGKACEISRGITLCQRKDSTIEVVVEGGKPGDALELGIGIRRLPQEQFAFDTASGLMANRGLQDPGIGFVGLAVAFPPKAFLRYADLPNEHQAIVRIEPGKSVAYGIEGDWLNGRRFSRCPSLEDWMDEMRGPREHRGPTLLPRKE